MQYATELYLHEMRRTVRGVDVTDADPCCRRPTERAIIRQTWVCWLAFYGMYISIS